MIQDALPSPTTASPSAFVPILPPSVVIQPDLTPPALEAMDVDAELDFDNVVGGLDRLVSDPLGAFALIATSPRAGTAAVLLPPPPADAPTSAEEDAFRDFSYSTSAPDPSPPLPISDQQRSPSSPPFGPSSFSSVSSASTALAVLADASSFSPPAGPSALLLRSPPAVTSLLGVQPLASLRGESAPVDGAGGERSAQASNSKGKSKKSSPVKSSSRGTSSGSSGSGSASSGGVGGGSGKGDSSSNPPPPVRNNRQARTLRDPACTSCRSLKKKCPGGTPCAPCLRAGRTCVYKCGVPARSRKRKGESGIVLSGGVGGGSTAPATMMGVKVETAVSSGSVPIGDNDGGAQRSDDCGSSVDGGKPSHTDDDDDELEYELEEDPSGLLMDASTTSGYVDASGSGGHDGEIDGSRRLSTSSAGPSQAPLLAGVSPSAASGAVHLSPLGSVGGYASLPPVNLGIVGGGSNNPFGGGPCGVGASYPTTYVHPPAYGATGGSHVYGSYAIHHHPIMPSAGHLYASPSNVRSD
jgi:hypothetical protein